MSLWERLQRRWRLRTRRHLAKVRDAVWNQYTDLSRKLCELDLRLHIQSSPPEEAQLPPEIEWPPNDAPETFGYRTLRKPYQGRPDFKLSRDVARLLHGKLDPTKRVKHVECVAIYEDDTETLVFTRSGHCRIFVEDLSIHIDPPLTLFEHQEPPDVLPPVQET